MISIEGPPSSHGVVARRERTCQELKGPVWVYAEP